MSIPISRHPVKVQSFQLPLLPGELPLFLCQIKHPSSSEETCGLQVIEVIDTEALPILKRCSLAGHAELKTHNPLFSNFPIAADMLMDILTDRGFATAYFMDEQVVPDSVDLKTGEVRNRYEYMHHFRSVASSSFA